MKVQEIARKTTEFFLSKGIESARLDAELLLASSLGWRRLDIYLKYDYPMSEEELARAREMVKRRAQGEPIAYILGKKEFYQSEFFVQPGVLVPRPETELLVEAAINFLNKKKQSLTSAMTESESTIQFKVADFGTGTGCIGLSITKALQEVRLCAFDISTVAQQVFQKNSELLGLQDRCNFYACDLNDAADSLASVVKSQEPFDLVAANPPYIALNDSGIEKNVVKFEPHEALFAAEEGFKSIRLWSKKASECLKNGGAYIFEIGAQQGEQVITEMKMIFSDVQLIKDYAGHDRIVFCIK
jgi:release factor glutamine methyltransferase